MRRHELKTPLASIKLLSDSILQNDMDADTMREFVSDIGNESDRLTRMTQKLLTLSKADAETVCDHEVVDLSEIVRRVFRMLVPLADKTEVRLTANLDRGCFVLSMEDDAYQIIFNLVENGIKYNHSGGCVHVTVSHTQEDVELLVEDTGMGIPQAAIEHIFERFYRRGQGAFAAGGRLRAGAFDCPRTGGAKFRFHCRFLGGGQGHALYRAAAVFCAGGGRGRCVES